MKKLLLAGMAALLLGPAGFSSTEAMDSLTLHSHPEQYRILFADDNQVIYGDMQSFSGIETRDLPSSIENMSLTLYVEKYISQPTDLDYAEGKTVSSISEYQATLSGNKVKGTCDWKTTLSAQFDAQGHSVQKEKSCLSLSKEEIYDVFRTLFRVSRVRK